MSKPNALASVDLGTAEKPSRTLAEIQSEYQNLCARAGQTQYQVYALQRELEVFNEKLRDLNFEGAKAQQEAADAAAKETANA